MKQEERILVYLKRHGSITPLEAWQHCGVYRLSAIIHRLRKHYLIKTERTPVTNRFGEVCHVANYKFKEIPYGPH